MKKHYRRHTGGRVADAWREAYVRRFGVMRDSHTSRYITDALMRQLGACRDDSARRLILGVSEQWI